MKPILLIQLVVALLAFWLPASGTPPSLDPAPPWPPDFSDLLEQPVGGGSSQPIHYMKPTGQQPHDPTGIPALTLTKTVGTDPATCAATHSITLPPSGGQVTYCYTAANTGSVLLTRHSLIDDQFGMLLDDFAYDLEPYTSYILTYTITITAPTVNTATWVAMGTGQSVWATDSASVWLATPQPTIALTKTVGIDPLACATTDELTLPPGGGQVTYCYAVQNTGNIAFDFHDLYDDQLGSLLFHWPAVLVPGATAAVTHAVTITETTGNEGFWTAFSAEGLWASDADTARVIVTPLDANIVVDPTELSIVQPPDQVSTRTLTIGNTGLTDLGWSIQESLTPGCECPCDVPWLAARPVTGTTASNTSDAVQVTINSMGLPLYEFYDSALCIRSNDPDPGPGNETNWVIVPTSLYTAVPVAVTGTELSAESATTRLPRSLLLIAVPTASALALGAGWILRRRRQAVRETTR